MDPLRGSDARRSNRERRPLLASILRGEGGSLPAWARYVMALVLFSGAVAARFAMLPLDGGLAFVTFYPAMALAALLFGTGPGLLVVVLSAIAAPYFFMAPYWSFSLVPANTLSAMIFFFSGLVVCFITYQMSLRNRELRESAEKLSGLFELSPLGIAATDMSGRYVEFNEAFRKICGYSADELKALDYWQLTPSRYQADEARQLESLERTGRYGPYRKEYQRKDGSLVPLQLNGMLITGRDGRRYCWSIVEDITEQKRAEEILQTSEQRFRDFSSSSADWFWEMDAALRFSYLSENLEAASGVNPVNLLGKTRGEFLDRDGLNGGEVAEHLELLDRHQPFRNFQCRIRDDAGEIRWISLSGVPYLDPAGQFAGYRGVGQNITAQKKAEQEADQASQLLREAVQKVASGFAIYDRDDRLVICNDAYLNKYSISREVIVPGARFEDIVRRGAELGQYKGALEDVETWVRQRVAQHRNPTGQSFEQELGDGRILLVVESRTPSGYIVGNRIDITERKRIENQLRKLSLAVEQSAESIVITDRDATIEYVNEAFVRRTGYSREEAIGRNANFLKSGQTPQETYVGFWAALSSGRAWQGEMINRRKNGEVYPEYIIASPIRQPDGAITHYVAIKEDITEKRRTARARQELEQQLWHAQKMEAIGQLASGIAHDFNNLLAVILGFAEFARNAVTAERLEKLGYYIDEILQASHTGKDLVAQLLTFSRSEAAEVDPVPVAPVVTEVVRLLRATLGKEIQVDLDIEVGLAAVRMSPVHFHQILMNLGINIRDACQGRGQVDIRVAMKRLANPLRCASCGQEFSGEFVRLSVRDDGPGIAPENLARIFDPFFSTKDVGKGTGLGLSVIHGIVHAASGHIRVESYLGAGTRFDLFLPASEALCRPSQKQTTRAFPARNLSGRLLVVDDENSIIAMEKELFESAGCEVVATTDPVYALDLVTVNPGRFDLVLIDQLMPGMSGITLAREIMLCRADLPIVMCSGQDDSSQAAPGVWRFLRKPVSGQVMLQTVRELLPQVTETSN